jgi:acetyl/propionyl-CoA carboxylase alpha subunit
MLAKVIGHAGTRDAAAALLSDSLARMNLHGPVSNRDSLVAILRSPAFLAGDTTTAFLDDHPQVLRPIGCAEDGQRHAIAAAYVVEAIEAPADRVPLGWRNVPAAPQFATLQLRGRPECTTVLVDRRRDGDRVRLARTEEVPYGRVFALEAEEVAGASVHLERDADGLGHVVMVEVGGVSARCSVSVVDGMAFVDDGAFSTAWTVQPRFADHSLDAAGHGPSTSVPGTITAVLVTEGETVAAGQPLVVLEAMKMEHRILADVEGTIARVLVQVGQSVEAHTVVVEFTDAAAGAEETP